MARSLRERRGEIANECSPSTPSLDFVQANLAKSYHEYKTDYDLWHPAWLILIRSWHLWRSLISRTGRRNVTVTIVLWASFINTLTLGNAQPPLKWPGVPVNILPAMSLAPSFALRGGYTAFYVDLKSRFVYAKVLRHKTDHYDAFVEIIHDSSHHALF